MPYGIINFVISGKESVGWSQSDSICGTLYRFCLTVKQNFGFSPKDCKYVLLLVYLYKAIKLDLKDIKDALEVDAELKALLENEVPDNTASPITVQPESKANKVNTGKPQRVINVEKFKSYFKPAFKGMGSNLNYFDWLVSYLQIDRTPKAFAQIALMIYDSNKALNSTKPRTFKSWYSIFCECVGCEQKTYQPKDLRNPSDSIKGLFNYL